MTNLADQRARNADVRGVERVIARIYRRDAWLGGMRPDTVNALVATVEERLDAARRLRLARDRWALRAPDLATYRAAISRPLDIFAQLRPGARGHQVAGRFVAVHPGAHRPARRVDRQARVRDFAAR